MLAAALVALARRIIVFFNPDAPEQHVGEMYAYVVLVAALSAAYAVINMGLMARYTLWRVCDAGYE